jgi:hypothetical protein
MLTIGACKPPDDSIDNNDLLLAQAYNKSLYLSELAGMVPENSSPEDSSLIVNAYIEKWVRENLLMHEAEKNVPHDLNIDELVRDYRASLIRHNYEKLLVELQLDSIVNDAELMTYYEKSKDQYRLKNMILRCYLIKVPRDFDDLTTLQKLWSSDDPEDYKTLVDFSRINASVYMLNDSIWYDLPDIVFHLPRGFLTASNAYPNRDYNTMDDNFRYFLRIFETTPAKEYPPLLYIESQAKKVILHKRKIKLLEEKKEEMYERELRRNNVKIYTH